MMFLKYRYRLGYEPPCREMSDSIAWRRFCRVPLDQAAPHPTTLMKITSRCGERAVTGLNDALLAKAAENKVIKTDKVRADTTVVEADVVYPTRLGTASKGVAKPASALRSRPPAWLPAPPPATARSVRRRAHSIGAWLRRRSDDAKEEAKAITGEMATIALWPSPMPATWPSTPAEACAPRQFALRPRRRAGRRAREHGGAGRAGGGPDPGPPRRRGARRLDTGDQPA